MLPFLHIGSFSLPTYGLMLSLAIMTAMFVMDRAIKRAHLAADAVSMVATAALAGIVGSKIWYLVLDSPEDFRAMGWSVLWQNSGFSWLAHCSSESWRWCSRAGKKKSEVCARWIWLLPPPPSARAWGASGVSFPATAVT